MRAKSLITVILLFNISIGVYSQSITRVVSNDVGKLLKNNPEMVVLDVRTPMEFNQGHVKGAINIDISQPNFYDKILKLDKEKTYLVYCRTHNRSGAAVNYMSQNGFKNLYQMTDGISGWNMNHLVLESK